MNETRRELRIKEQYFDPRYMLYSQLIMRDNDDIDCPIFYVLKVQVKSWIFWHTVWEARCEVADWRSRRKIIEKASNIISTIEGHGDIKRN